jgi:subtilisin family serine protease
MKRAALAVGATLLATACQDASAPRAPSPDIQQPSFASTPAAEAIPGQYIVVLRESVGDVPGVARELLARNGGTLRFAYTAALKGFSGNITAEAAALIANDPRVAYVEQNQVVRAITEQTGATWGIDRIDQRDLPLSTTYVYNATGQGVRAYIIDTGIRTTHVDFAGRAVSGTDKVDNDNDASDCNGHGTHVAGTVGGTTWGVAKNVTLVAVRVLDCGGSGSWEGVIAGVDWVTEDHQAGQPAVANMSLGGGFSQAVNDAVTNSVNDGVTYGVAAGNGYANACDGSPASTAAALTVGATGSNDVEASFSDRGPCLDIWAPGVGITSAWSTADDATNTISGTSMATPHVVGAAALYLEGNPSAAADQVDQALSDNATTGKITWNNPFGAKPPPPPAGQDYLLYTGFIFGGPPPPPPPAPAAPNALVATAVGNARIDLTWADNSDNESGFKIERCTGAGCTNFTQIATASANATSYSNTGLSESTTYTYRVRAHNAGGNSDYSNESASATPADANPVARYTWSCSGKAGRTCSFNATTSTDDWGIQSYSWNFGDGTTGSGATVTKTYGKNGTRTVTLTVTDNASPGQTHARSCAVATNSSGTCQ